MGRTQRGARFSRWMRVVRQRDFARAYKSGSRARGKLLTLVAAHNGTDTTRLGLSIGKRFHKHAVVRNRLRRLVREAFRLSYGDLPRGYDLIAVGSEPGTRAELETLRAELVRLARRAADRAEDRRTVDRAEDRRTVDRAEDRRVTDRKAQDPNSSDATGPANASTASNPKSPATPDPRGRAT